MKNAQAISIDVVIAVGIFLAVVIFVTVIFIGQNDVTTDEEVEILADSVYNDLENLGVIDNGVLDFEKLENLDTNQTDTRVCIVLKQGNKTYKINEGFGIGDENIKINGKPC